jgi:hypothetical protein
LAAALLSFGSPFEAAKALYRLLDVTSPSSQALPTVQQLKDLFIALEKNIGYTGFIDNLKGWEMLLTMPELGVQSLFEDSNRFASCMKFERLGQLLD